MYIVSLVSTRRLKSLTKISTLNSFGWQIQTFRLKSRRGGGLTTKSYVKLTAFNVWRFFWILPCSCLKYKSKLYFKHANFTFICVFLFKLQNNTTCVYFCLFVSWCLTPPSTYFQLYCGGHFYWWKKLEDPETNTDLNTILSKTE